MQSKTTYDHTRNCNTGQVFTDREGKRVPLAALPEAVQRCIYQDRTA